MVRQSFIMEPLPYVTSSTQASYGQKATLPWVTSSEINSSWKQNTLKHNYRRYLKPIGNPSGKRSSPLHKAASPESHKKSGPWYHPKARCIITLFLVPESFKLCNFFFCESRRVIHSRFLTLLRCFIKNNCSSYRDIKTLHHPKHRNI